MFDAAGPRLLAYADELDALAETLEADQRHDGQERGVAE
jgi:hypothetical protein